MLSRSTLVLLIVSTLASACPAEDWPRWRGVRGDGTWNGPQLQETWPDKGLKTRWKTAIGAGYAGVSVVGERVYVMDRQADPDRSRTRPLFRRTRPVNRFGHIRTRSSTATWNTGRARGLPSRSRKDRSVLPRSARAPELSRCTNGGRPLEETPRRRFRRTLAAMGLLGLARSSSRTGSTSSPAARTERPPWPSIHARALKCGVPSPTKPVTERPSSLSTAISINSSGGPPPTFAGSGPRRRKAAVEGPLRSHLWRLHCNAHLSGRNRIRCGILARLARHPTGRTPN